jgi:hypothetical protein
MVHALVHVHGRARAVTRQGLHRYHAARGLRARRGRVGVGVRPRGYDACYSARKSRGNVV